MLVFAVSRRVKQGGDGGARETSYIVWPGSDARMLHQSKLLISSAYIVAARRETRRHRRRGVRVLGMAL